MSDRDITQLSAADVLPYIEGFSALHLRFVLRAKDDIAFGSQPGSAVRGALYQALSQHFCSEKHASLTDDHVKRCPVCWLLAAEDPQRVRGKTMPRPVAIQPPEKTHVQVGETWQFGLTCIGQAQDMTLYLLRAVQTMGHIGIGKGRGHFVLERIYETSPLLHAERDLLDKNTVQQPRLHVTHRGIEDALTHYPDTHVFLDFLTPCRLISRGQLKKEPQPVVLISRLVERIQALMQYYTDSEEHDWRWLYRSARHHAESLELKHDTTDWQEHFSGSRRQNRMTPISGFTGQARWDGEIQPLLPLLLVGQSVQAGKNTVKGNGWYRLTS